MAANELKQKAMLQKAITILFLVFISVPAVSFANGGDQRVVEGKYLINLSRAPFTPRVGVKTSMLASFVDIQKNKLVGEDLIVKVRIAKLGGGEGKREFLFEKENLIVKGGVLELSYTFAETGLHEIFFDFAFASRPEIIYEAPDFLLDIQPGTKEPLLSIPLLWFIIGAIGGVFTTWFLIKRVKQKH